MKHRPLPTFSSRQLLFTRKVQAQKGLTLVELMVAMAIGLVVTLASVSALLVSRSGYNVVDAGSQLRENTRFAADMVKRIVAQTGSLNPMSGSNADTKKCGPMATAACTNQEAEITGFNNAVFLPGVAQFPPVVTNDSRVAACGSFADTSCANGSDVLIVRYAGSSLSDASPAADGSIINCAGVAEAQPVNYNSRSYAVFHVARSLSGEPALMCSYRGSTGNWVSQAIVQGVETFQVLYGVSTSTSSSTPDHLYRADELLVAGDPVATRNNWRRVRSVHIGMVLRSAPGAATANTPTVYYPFTAADTPATAGTDPGVPLTVALDGRLRQTLSFTVAMRNRLEIN